MLNLHDITVNKAMTPRTVCETVPPNMTVSEFDEQYVKAPFTRFPVHCPCTVLYFMRGGAL